MPQPDLLAAVAPQLRQASDAGRWLIGFSGGRDSLALLDLVHLWSAEHSTPDIRAIHINHGLHPQAEAWATHCAAACDARNIPLEVHTLRPASSADKGPEAAARDARYRVFADSLAAGDMLMLAHHADDQVETVLYRLLRGAGPAGLRGMPARRALAAGEIFRPLLAVSREDISAWVSSRGLDYIEDPSNADTSLDRNYLRHAVLPLIAARWPGYRQTVTRAAALQGRAVDQLLTLPLNLTESRFAEPGLIIDPDLEPPALADQLHRWLLALGQQTVPAVRLQEFARQLLQAGSDRQPRLPLDRGALQGWRDTVYLIAPSLCDTDWPQAVTVGAAVSGPWGALFWEQAALGLRAEARLQLRRPVAGEQFAPLGGGARSLGQLCQERGVPPWRRADLPVLCCDDVPVALAGIGLLAGAETTDMSTEASGWLPRWQPGGEKPGENASSIEGAGAC